MSAGTFPDARWSFPKEMLDRLAEIRDRIRPHGDPVLQFYWLFQQHVQLPDVDERDYREHEQAVADRRREALEKIVAARGIGGVHDLLARAEKSQAIGQTLGEHRIVSPSELDIPTTLEAKDDSRRICAFAYCNSRFWSEGWQFVEELPIRQWTAEQAAALAASFRFDRATWEWIATISPYAETLYWQRCRAYLREPTTEDVDYAVQKLLGVERTFTAADFVHMCTGKDFTLDDERVLNLLEQGLRLRCKEDAQHTDCYAVRELISQLQKSADIDKGRLARVEWGYLPVLDRFAQVQPTTLFQVLYNDPQFFYDLLTVQYRAEDEDPGEDVPSEHEQNVARLAHDLLDQFGIIPGTQDDGTIDAASLNAWIDDVRTLAQEGKRLAVCDIHIGTVFSHCPMHVPLDANSHTVWPQ